MPSNRRNFASSAFLTALVALALLLPFSAGAQSPPEPPAPQPDASYGNLFYGAVPPKGANGPVLVFVPGLLETAYMWWNVELNDMYAYAFQAGYRTAFMSPNIDNLATTTGISTNSQMLATLMPLILAHYGVSQVYFVGHSLGGLDIQALLVMPGFLNTAKAVFTLATPNQGTVLANWLFSSVGEPTAIQLGWLIPGVQNAETGYVSDLRKQWDPILKKAHIPFFTMAGTSWLGNPATQTCGPILQGLTGGFDAPPNDGVLTVPESHLPFSYAKQIGLVNGNHFDVAQGHNVFPRMKAQIEKIEAAR